MKGSVCVMEPGQHYITVVLYLSRPVDTFQTPLDKEGQCLAGKKPK